jgi:hypothetical protein
VSAESEAWTDGVAQVLARMGPPGCELCGSRSAYSVRIGATTWWLCGRQVCRTLAGHVRTLGDLGQAIRAAREAA